MITETEYNNAVKAYTKNVFRFIMKSLKSKEATEDLVQDCFMKLWQNRETVDASKIKAWLFTTAHNAMINYVKVAARSTALDAVSNHDVLIEATTNFDVKAIIERSLNELPPVQKSVVLLRDLEGYNYQEIADILKLTDAQVRVYLFRARKKIKDSIKTLSSVL